MAANSQVLARKYRPQIFDDLIGQEALVQTVTNAIKQNRLAQAYMLTGIRGIGKTTSARIIAKGINCIGEDGNGGMTPNPCGKCKHCRDIANDSHIDVIEIDAASNTGVDNVREIIEGAKYNPVSARYKVYIIDEVHMLSKQAFNALLKTLEEPPERVKFIFATTEIRKVPLTILSRCQRFDLKRIQTDKLAEYLATICEKEKKQFSSEALYLIAKAGNGSVRDALSLLDQAFTQLPDNPTPELVREMLGVADKGALLDLYQATLNGQMELCFDLLSKQYESGSDALILVQDLLDLTHTITCLKVSPRTTVLSDFTENEQKILKELATKLSMHTITANWQLLIKGIQEVRMADAPFQATEMLLIRMAYMSDVPPPEQLLAEVKKNAETSVKQVPQIQEQKLESQTSVKAPERPRTTFQNIKEIYELAHKSGELILACHIETFIHPIEIKPGELVCTIDKKAPNTLPLNLAKLLRDKTGDNWIITQREGGKPSLKEQKEKAKQQLLDDIQKDPAVAEIERLFAGAKIEKVRPTKSAETADVQSEEET